MTPPSAVAVVPLLGTFLHATICLRLSCLHHSLQGGRLRGRWRLAALLFCFEAPAAAKCAGVLAMIELVRCLDGLRLLAGMSELGPANEQTFLFCATVGPLLTPMLLLVLEQGLRLVGGSSPRDQLLDLSGTAGDQGRDVDPGQPGAEALAGADATAGRAGRTLRATRRHILLGVAAALLILGIAHLAATPDYSVATCQGLPYWAEGGSPFLAVLTPCLVASLSVVLGTAAWLSRSPPGGVLWPVFTCCNLLALGMTAVSLAMGSCGVVLCDGANVASSLAFLALVQACATRRAALAVPASTCLQPPAEDRPGASTSTELGPA